MELLRCVLEAAEDEEEAEESEVVVEDAEVEEDGCEVDEVEEADAVDDALGVSTVEFLGGMNVGLNTEIDITFPACAGNEWSS